MNHIMRKTFSLLFICGCTACLTAQNPAQQIDVNLQQIGAPIPTTMYGVFFEDINFGADGGLYAELVKNRSFEFDNPLSGWIPFGTVTIDTKNPCFPRNPHYAHLQYTKELTGTGLDNEGFRGMGIHGGEKYDLSFYARTISGTIKLRVNLVDSNNDLSEQQTIEVNGNSWKKYTLTLNPEETDSHSSLRITMETKGSIDLDHISLFPQNTFNHRKNGLRADLAQTLKDLHPGIMRFPGGCIVEGNNMSNRYEWKKTIGPVENRPINVNRWNFTFKYKKFSDYYQSYGLGFFEFFQLCEDIGADALPVLNCGLSCQFENHDPKENCPVDKLQPYIDDALDLIEFANGPVTSKYGKIRAEMGHEAPFNLKFLAIGNEQWGTLYTERLVPFVKAIREKYPNIHIIGSAGPSPDGKEFDFLWPEMKRIGVDLVDEHYYRSPEWFLSNANRYDSYDRQGPKVFAGEYACHTPSRTNSFYSALCEAAFMTGFERNADVVNICTYAPLFAHIDAWQWRPDLIWFDNLKAMKTPDYFVQQLYSLNKGTNVLKLTMNGQAVTGQNDLFATAAIDKTTNDLIVKVANTGIQSKKIKFNLIGLSSGKHKTSLSLLHSDNIEEVNTLQVPDKVTPTISETEIANGDEIRLLPLSFTVYRIRL